MSFGSRFDGYGWNGANGPDGQTPEGASSVITVRTGAVCTGSHTSVWTMLAENKQALTTYGDQGYAQIGYIHNAGQPIYVFTQWHRRGGGYGGATYSGSGALTTGTTVQFWVQFITSGCQVSNPCLALNKGTTRVAYTDFDPYGYWDLSLGNFQPELAGETHDAGDAIPGAAGSEVGYRNTQLQQESDNSFTTGYSQSFSSVVTAGYHYCQTSFNYTAAVRGFNIWTDPSC